MPIDRKDLLFLSKIPFQLSGEEHLTPVKWCFYLSFNWGIHKELPPSSAQKLLTLALQEKILEKQNETLTLKEKQENSPLYKFDKKIDPKELINVEPYPIKTKIEHNEVELQIQSIMKKEKKKEPLAGHFQKSKEPSPASKEEMKGEKQKEELKESKEESKEEKAKQKTKPTKKQKSKDEKPELTLDHFTKNPKQ